MAPPVETSEDALPEPPVTPSAGAWRAMTPQARERFIDEVVVAFSDPRWNDGNGQPHNLAKRRATDRLRRHFDAIGRRIYLTEGELSVLYPGERAFCPDILAVVDVPEPEDDERMAWVVADEGRGLDLVIEVLYEGRRKKDLVDNVERYARLGIPEYFVYDRKKQQLHGFRLPAPEARRYQRIVPQAGRYASGVLGLDLAIEKGKLEFFYGMAAIFGTEDLIGRLQGMMQSLEAKAEQAEAQVEQAQAKAEQAEAQAEQAQAKAEQALTSLQNSLLAIVAARGIPCSDDDRERVRSCVELETLQRWLVRAATVGSMAEVLAENA
ncbi:Uma2 family endonuclease [Polyangium jinanense]|uniref:Uma2 family endonuclease n=1 Tax=Polyangium jinanense TaxID=2829994 RepID=A0A9X3WZE5_9BACT|nr:Uma2 family endonuclease [Polyangium jinanense]MDC3955071.1 Uma2 family endonuclease [Polyangium jinanense]MDC3981159.1 Uma2 family endonuclease [Polyangium jinanense]